MILRLRITARLTGPLSRVRAERPGNVVVETLRPREQYRALAASKRFRIPLGPPSRWR